MTLAVIAAGLFAGLASIPHCAAMCGSLAAFSCARRPARWALPRWQGGRMVGYAVVGAIAGGMGGFVVGPGAARWAPALVSWSCALALAVAALRIWPRSTSTRRTLLRLRPSRDGAPSAVTAASLRVMRGLDGSPALFGAATALLPCGALASALLLSASAASVPGGALAMIAFAVGSAPGLLGVGWLVGLLARVRTATLPARLLAAALLVGALLLAARPIPALLGGPPCHCHAPAAQRLD